jgi:hypothetical protein
LRSILVAGEHHLLGPARFRAAEIDAFLDRQWRAVRAQPETLAGGQAQQGGAMILLQAGGDLRVQMEADHEGLRLLGLDEFLAAQILAAFGEVEPAVMDGAE